ncbi:Fpg/Nei family DNA glycosylase [Streptomyces iconiensis]|uniref:DNA-formamidopyrimidine glycosylase family protein n=1 Tax=Streptomyces iconiensis TaxID=1384038 RepID=A0ABT6ZQB0_9ACTN|nr:DNA-formamidopyrimidine glycosylase family protein [Streptomyces iconiensis]MDJ1131037.1 DNA-formamidopyrimidine glycosylase family protein [Streptomyces iconiensis]
MPELPEVEALRGFLEERLTGRTVAHVWPVAVNVLKTYDPPPSALEGRAFTEVARHGKFLAMRLDDLSLVVHLARAGWLRWQETLPTTPPRPGKGPLAFRVGLEGAGGFDLTEAGTQKRLAVSVVRDPSEVPGIARLGPDPLSPAFDRAAFAALLKGQRHRIKGLLRDQSVISGIGNAYSDEILHAAKTSPFKIADELTEDEVTGLYEALTDTLGSAVGRARGLSAAELKAGKRLGLRVHGRAGETCPVCGDTIRSVSFRDSSLEYCPTCQTGGKPLADRRLSRLLK